MKTLYLIRGIPGSGKTTFARKLLEQGKVQRHFEADMFFIEKDGVYRYRKELIVQAHTWCQKQTLEALSQRHSVVVSNTFITINELMPYYNIATITGADVKVIRATGNFENQHNVPADIVSRMKQQYQAIPNEVLDSQFSDIAKELRHV